MNSSGSSQPLIVLAANSSFNIVNFRMELIRRLEQSGYRILVMAPRAKAELAEHAFAVADLPVDRSGLNPVRDVVLLWRLRSLLAGHGAAALLGFTVKPNIYGALACRSLNIPAIPNVSGLGTAFIGRGLLSRFVGALYRVAFRRCPAVMFQNHDDLDLFVARGFVERGQACLLPGSGIDLAKFAPAPLPDGPPVFLMIARLLGDKGVREYAGAARRVKLARPDWRFRLLGAFDRGNRTGISRAELQQWVDEGGIEYLGETGDVRPAIAAASAVVLPSYREGLPRTLLEGAAMGRPVVATDVPGCRELVDDGVTGYRCASRDVASLVEAMLRLGDLPRAQFEAMGSAARRMAEKKFSIERVSDAYLGVLDQMMSNKLELRP
jgi:glycosyltransferase involved in cell wall biosynthesis